jgi:precorrin isomerase
MKWKPQLEQMVVNIGHSVCRHLSAQMIESILPHDHTSSEHEEVILHHHRAIHATGDIVIIKIFVFFNVKFP